MITIKWLELKTNLGEISYDNVNITYDNLVKTYTNLLDKFAPIKSKTVRGNKSRFMNKILSKAIIMKRSSLKSKYLKEKSSANKVIFKKQTNLCKRLRDKAIKMDFDKAFSELKLNSKPF